MRSIKIAAGSKKTGERENFYELEFFEGEMIAIVGNTGAGKSRLIKDIEQLAKGDTVTKRIVTISGFDDANAENIIAHLGQNMKFVLDITIEEFFSLHARCRNKSVVHGEILEIANTLTMEKVKLSDRLNELSGGQKRAVMIADIAMICDSQIVLIDEIENAGIDKEKALSCLVREGKLVLCVTHDTHTALACDKRVILANGGVEKIIETSEEEKILYSKMSEEYKKRQKMQSLLRKGEILA